MGGVGRERCRRHVALVHESAEARPGGHLAWNRIIGDTVSMNSRVHPSFKTRYRVTNWPEYDRGLVQRGDVTVWLSSDAIDAWHGHRTGKRGAQPKFSDLAIETALTLRLVFHLPLRQAEGFVRSLFALMDVELDVPDHTTLSRRATRLRIDLRRVRRAERIHLVIDSSGLSIVGEGEWSAAKHGGSGRRGWKKLDLGVDANGEILAHVLTDSVGDDATNGLDLIDRVDGDVGSITADAAYDTVAIYDAWRCRGARVIIPPSRTASVSRRKPRSRAQDRTIQRVTSRQAYWPS